MKNINLSLFITILFVSFSQVHAADEPSYCLAIRGNGEALAAHWMPMAKLVESMGMPKAMAGGSSGSITMFYLDSLAGNSKVNSEPNEEKRRKMQAFLLRTMPDFHKYLVINSNMLTIAEIGKDVAAKKTMWDRLEAAKKGYEQLDEGTIRQIYGKYFGLLNPELLRGLVSTDTALRNHYINLAQQSIAVFGHFDANDPNLFFRPGVVDFKHLALVVGTIGDFYSGNMDNTLNERLKVLAQNCAEGSSQRARNGDCALKAISLNGESYDCKSEFKKVVLDYLKKKTIREFQNKRIFDPIGKNIPSFVSTSVIRGDSYDRYMALKEKMLGKVPSAETLQEAKDFSINPKDLGCKYFGNNGQITDLQSKLADLGFTDVKNHMISEMDHTGSPRSWHCILSLSPAEPGLANFQDIPKKCEREDILAKDDENFHTRWKELDMEPGVVSGGGWCDLQPIPILKAAGCDLVAYDTRQNGETQFGQKVNIRLMGDKVPYWNFIGRSIPTDAELAKMKDVEKRKTEVKMREETLTFLGESDVEKAKVKLKKLNDFGGWPTDDGIKETYWYRNWFKQPYSSSEISIRAADIVACTDWDNFAVFAGEQDQMTAQACGAPFYAKDTVPEKVRSSLSSIPPKKYHPGCVAKPLPSVGPASVEKDAGAK